MRPLVFVFLPCLLALGCGGASSSSTGSGGAGTTSSSSNSAVAASSSGAGGLGGGAASSSSSGAGGSTSGSAVASSSSSSGGTADAGSTPHGDCQTDADCPDGKCVELTPGGFLTCQTPPKKATACVSDLDQCCADQPCPNNEPCLAGPLVLICTGVFIEPHNQCATDQCTKDADCAEGQLCVPAGTLGRQIRACVPAGCKVDADCNLMPGGLCAPVKEPCCGYDIGLFCVYPSGGCRSNADCPAGRFCQTSDSQALCQTGSPLCPQ